MKAVYDIQNELKIDPITVTPVRSPVTWHHKVFFVGAPACRTTATTRT